jgi:hypothetical protein
LTLGFGTRHARPYQPSADPAKGAVFLTIGLIASALLLFEAPTLKVATLLALTVWAFCRFH